MFIWIIFRFGLNF
jgi:hypothetical protein